MWTTSSWRLRHSQLGINFWEMDGSCFWDDGGGLDRHDEEPVSVGQVCAEATDKESRDVSWSQPDREARRDRAHVPLDRSLVLSIGGNAPQHHGTRLGGTSITLRSFP